MIQPRELAPIIGKMIVNGEALEGDALADYLQRMPYDDLVSLLEDRALVGLEKPKKTKCHCGKPLNENGLCWCCDPISTCWPQ